jgi:hypothetical protein
MQTGRTAGASMRSRTHRRTRKLFNSARHYGENAHCFSHTHCQIFFNLYRYTRAVTSGCTSTAAAAAHMRSSLLRISESWCELHNNECIMKGTR